MHQPDTRPLNLIKLYMFTLSVVPGKIIRAVNDCINFAVLCCVFSCYPAVLRHVRLIVSNGMLTIRTSSNVTAPTRCDTHFVKSTDMSVASRKTIRNYQILLIKIH